MKKLYAVMVLFLWGVCWGERFLDIHLSSWDILRGEVTIYLRLEFATNVVKKSDIATMREQFEKKFFLDFSPKLKYTLEFVDEKTVNVVVVDRLLPARRYSLTVRALDANLPKGKINDSPLLYDVPIFLTHLC